MSSSPQSRGSEPALLLVVAHGVGVRAITALRADAAMPPHAMALDRSSEGALTLLAGAADATPLLRELGVAVDRSSLVLRSTASCDDQAIAALSRRPTGPAHATILELRSVVETGVAAGLDAVPAALSLLAQRIAGAALRVRSGEPTEVWLLGLGDLQPVSTTFDFEHAWRNGRARPIADELEVLIGLGCVTLRATNQRARDIARETLTDWPFGRYGAVTEEFDHRLRFVAAPGVAFGRRRVAARPPNREEAGLQALLPRAPRAAEIAPDLRAMIARFWMRAAAHANLGHAAPDPSPATAAPTSVDGAASLVKHSTPAPGAEVDSALRRR